VSEIITIRYYNPIALTQSHGILLVNNHYTNNNSFGYIKLCLKSMCNGGIV